MLTTLSEVEGRKLVKLKLDTPEAENPEFVYVVIKHKTI
jgi:hypothetical protein